MVGAILRDRDGRRILNQIYVIQFFAYKQGRYQQDDAGYKSQLEQYNNVVTDYYVERTGGERSDTWTSQMAEMLSHPQRMYMRDFVEEQGLNKQ